MSNELTNVDIELVRELIDNSNLTGVEFHEISAIRHDQPNEEIAPDQASLDVSVQFRIDDVSIGIRLVCDVHAMIGEARVAVSGEYALVEGFAPERRTVLAFANEVAVMTIFPYLREAVSDATSRVFGNPLYLPIAARGQIAFALDDE